MLQGIVRFSIRFRGVIVAGNIIAALGDSVGLSRIPSAGGLPMLLGTPATCSVFSGETVRSQLEFKVMTGSKAPSWGTCTAQTHVGLNPSSV
jgi:hypothetical protein